MTKPILEDKQRLANIYGIAGGIIVFFVVFVVFSTLSMNPFMGFILGIPAAIFAYNYIPVHWLGRKDPRIVKPRQAVYTLGPDEILGRLSKVFRTLRIEGKRWKELDEEVRAHTLIYHLEFKEEIPNDKGADVIEHELILELNAYQDPRSSEVSFLNLSYNEGSERVSIQANEIMKQTTEAIYSDLTNYEVILDSK